MHNITYIHKLHRDFSPRVFLMQNVKESDRKLLPEHLTLQVLEMLPIVHCVSPKTALSLMSRDEADTGSRVLMDEKEFESETYQRVYQYLRRHTANSNLDKFFYHRGSVEGSPQDCLETYFKYIMHLCILQRTNYCSLDIVE